MIHSSNVQNAPISHELYADIERECMPIIRSAASAFARKLGVGNEDAIQEGRLALLTALKGYEYNASKGGIYNFARAAVKNAMCGLLYAATTKGRCPHIVIEEDGVPKAVRNYPEVMGDFSSFSSTEPDPEAMAAQGEVVDKLRELKMQLMNRLNQRQLEVFGCLYHHKVEFEVFLRNKQEPEATHELIAEYLGVTKNTVDWSVHQIKRHFTALSESKFSDIIQEAIQEGKWPMFHVSERPNDIAFIQSIIKTRALDPRPTGAPDVKVRTLGSVRCVRSVEPYSWGSIIMLTFGERSATVVAEGKFNPISGEVRAETGFWKPISESLSWYSESNRFLNPKV